MMLKMKKKNRNTKCWWGCRGRGPLTMVVAGNSMTVLNGLIVSYRIKSHGSFLPLVCSGLFKWHFHKYSFPEVNAYLLLPPPTSHLLLNNHNYKASSCLDNALAKLTNDLSVIKGNDTLLSGQFHWDQWYRNFCLWFMIIVYICFFFSSV